DKARDTKRHIYQNGINRLQRADGAILLGEGDPQEVYQLLDEGYPFTFVGKRNSPQDNISYCAADYVTASMEVTDYLFKNGHRKIAYFRSQNPTEATQDRIEGFRAAYQRNNIELNESWIVDVSQGITLDLLLDHLNSGFSAFIAENDDIGRRILDTGGLSELECPRDYSLAVFGDPLNPIDDMPGWTHFSIPRRAMGREALNLLVNILNVESNEITEPLRKTLPCTFIQGSTVKTV
ncbi:MAG: LacI family DNA-binding transcriptional regulator, partial [Chloroflexota bacterium]